MGANNNHKTIQNDQIHPPLDFATGDPGDTMRKNLNSELEWSSDGFLPPVLDQVDINLSPPTEVDKDRYIVIELTSTVANSDWDGPIVNDIVEFSSTTGVWAARTPIEGDIVYDKQGNSYASFDGVAWTGITSGDPGGGGGLGGAISFDYKAKTTSQAAPPGDTFVKWDDSDQFAASNLFVSSVNDEAGSEIGDLLRQFVVAGMKIVIADRTDISQRQVWNIDTVTDNTTYFDYQVTLTGTAGAQFVNNEKLTLVFFNPEGTIVNTIYNSDDTLAGNRVVSGGGNTLNFDGLTGIGSTVPVRQFEVNVNDALDTPTMAIRNNGAGAASLYFEGQEAVTIGVDDNGLFQVVFDEGFGGASVLDITSGNFFFNVNVVIGSSVSLRIPHGVEPGLINAGQIAIDDNVTDFDEGVFTYFSTAEMAAISVLKTALASPVDGDTVVYSGANNRWEIAQPSGGGGGFGTFEFYADQVMNPNNADWVVNSLAPAVADSNNAGLTVRAFSDSTPEGFGMIFIAPLGANQIVIEEVSRPDATPGGAVTVARSIYNRGIPDNLVVEGWTAATDLTDIAFTTNEFFQYDTQTIDFSTLGITAGEVTVLEYVRDTADAGDTLSGDFNVLLVKISFADGA